MKVYIFGLGAIGSNIAVVLSRMYKDISLVGIDFDKVEERNIKTQSYFLEHTGVPKCSALLTVLYRYSRKVDFTGVIKKVETENDIRSLVKEPGSLILDCFDNIESRSLFAGIEGTVLHVGFSPELSGEIIWHERYDVPGDIGSDIDICSMDEAAPFIGYVVNLSCMVIDDFVKRDVKNSFIVTNRYVVKAL